MTNRFPELPDSAVDVRLDGGETERFDCPEHAMQWFAELLRDDLMVAEVSQTEAGFRVVAMIRQALLLPPAGLADLGASTTAVPQPSGLTLTLSDEDLATGCRYTTCGDSIRHGVHVALWNAEEVQERWYCTELHAGFALLDSVRDMGIGIDEIASMAQRSLDGQPMLARSPEGPAPPEQGIHLVAVNGHRKPQDAPLDPGVVSGITEAPEAP